MDITLEFRTKRSICLQIQDQIREKIREQRLKPGDQLPAVRDLAAVLKINFNTVARAYRELDRDGLISTQQGRGTYVLEQPDDTSETWGEVSDQVVEEILNRLFAEIEHRHIPESSLWHAIERRKAARRQFPAQTTRRWIRRVSHKPRHQQASAQWLAEPNHIKRISRKRSDL